MAITHRSHCTIIIASGQFKMIWSGHKVLRIHNCTKKSINEIVTKILNDKSLLFCDSRSKKNTDRTVWLVPPFLWKIWKQKLSVDQQPSFLFFIIIDEAVYIALKGRRAVFLLHKFNYIARKLREGAGMFISTTAIKRMSENLRYFLMTLLLIARQNTRCSLNCPRTRCRKYPLRKGVLCSSRRPQLQQGKNICWWSMQKKCFVGIY